MRIDTDVLRVLVKRMTPNSLKRIKDVLLGNEKVVLAYIFGSRASGRPREGSDWDIAVLLSEDNLALEAAIQSSIAKVLGVPEEKVDLINLKDAPLSLKFKVVREGIRLIDRGDFEKKIISDLNKKYPEVKFLRDLSLKEFIDGGELDKAVVFSRLEVAREEARYLREEMLKRTVDEVISSGTLRRALERSVQVLVEAILDICRLMVSVLGLGPAETYVEFVERLMREGYLPADLGEKLKEYVRLRNILVHKYLYMDHKILYERCRDLVEEVMPRFESFVRKMLAK